MDISALKAFHANLKPVIDAIPAVLDLVSLQNDLERAIAQKRQALQDLEADISKETALHAERMKSAQAQVKQEQDHLAATKRLVAEARAQQDIDIAAAKQALAEETQRLISQREHISAETARLESVFEAKRKAAEDAHRAHIETLSRETDDVLRLKQEAEAAVANLRSKLG